MIRKILLNDLTKLAMIALASISTAQAAVKNFNCPQPAEIQSTNFTAPSIWTAPAVAHSANGTPGVGLGGNQAVELLGIEEATINNKPGWVCVYKSKGGVSVRSYQEEIEKVIRGTSYLRKYTQQMDKYFDDAEPYLKKYPKDIPLGVIGYQAEENYKK